MQWLRDCRHAWRALLRTPGFLVTSAASLALAIGVVVGMFSVVYAVLLRPLPFPDAERLVVVSGTAPGSDLPERFGLGPDFYLHYKERSRLLDGIFMFDGGTSTFRTDERVERIPMAWPTNDVYATLRVRPQLGRLPTSDDADRAVVISDQLWSSWFGRNPGVIGKRYFVSGEMREVIGIMPPEFTFPSDRTQLWVAVEVRPADVRPGRLGGPLVPRMKPGVTREQLAAELTRLSKELPSRFGGTSDYVKLIDRHTAVVDPLLERIVGPTARTSLNDRPRPAAPGLHPEELAGRVQDLLVDLGRSVLAGKAFDAGARHGADELGDPREPGLRLGRPTDGSRLAGLAR